MVLTLNVLLSFAQFEREVTAERIRDKIAASKKKGMWMGGLVPLGYDGKDRTLIINAEESTTVRTLFSAYLELGNVRRLKEFADRHGLKTKRHACASGRQQGGASFSCGRLYHLLSNPVYIGRIRHRDKVHDGLHAAIIDPETWQGVQELLARNAPGASLSGSVRRTGRSPLTGRVFDEAGEPLTPSHAVKKGRRYRYYVSRSLIRDSGSRQDGWRLPAGELEDAVRAAIREDGSWKLANSLAGDDSSDPLSEVLRIQVSPDRIRIDIASPDAGPRQIDAPVTLARRGIETRLRVAGNSTANLGPVLIRRILRAMAWVDQIRAGRSLTDIAAAEGFTASFIALNINAALLSPAILSAIAEGRQPPHLTASMLTRAVLPDLWTAQTEALHIAL